MICIPIVSANMSRALADIATAEAIADIIELRVDLLDQPDLPALLKAASKPCIVTNRTKMEGGQFKGSEEQRVLLLRQAIDAGADYIDIEASTPKQYLKPILDSREKTKVILSYHDFSKTPEDLIPLYEIMREFPVEIIKIVTYAQDINDNLVAFKLLKRAREDGQKLISLCMGERGEISRVLSPILGGFLTFGSLDTGKESAPGQIPAAILKNVYRTTTAADSGTISETPAAPMRSRPPSSTSRKSGAAPASRPENSAAVFLSFSSVLHCRRCGVSPSTTVGARAAGS